MKSRSVWRKPTSVSVAPGANRYYLFAVMLFMVLYRPECIPIRTMLWLLPESRKGKCRDSEHTPRTTRCEGVAHLAWNSQMIYICVQILCIKYKDTA